MHFSFPKFPPKFEFCCAAGHSCIPVYHFFTHALFCLKPAFSPKFPPNFEFCFAAGHSCVGGVAITRRPSTFCFSNNNNNLFQKFKQQLQALDFFGTVQTVLKIPKGKQHIGHLIYFDLTEIACVIFASCFSNHYSDKLYPRKFCVLIVCWTNLFIVMLVFSVSAKEY